MNVWRGGLALGAVALAAAVASGSRALGVVGVGFLLASGLTWVWTWLAESPATVTYAITPAPGDRRRSRAGRGRGASDLEVAPRLDGGARDARTTRGAQLPAARDRPSVERRIRPRQAASRRLPDHRYGSNARRPPRSRLGVASHRLRSSDARGEAAARRARRSFQRCREGWGRRAAAAPSARGRVRLPLGSRARAG